MELLERLQALCKVQLFEQVWAEDLLLIARALSEKALAADDVIFREGEGGMEMYLVAEGSVRLVKEETGVELVVLGPGSFFGEMALFDEAPRSATAVCAGPVRLLVLSRSMLQDLLLERPQVSFPLLGTMSARLRDTTARLA